MLKPIHHGVHCNECQMKPLLGLRYRCTLCPSYNLCGICFPYEVGHDASHQFLAMRRPSSQLESLFASVAHGGQDSLGLMAVDPPPVSNFLPDPFHFAPQRVDSLPAFAFK
jgi:hypothetical protein